MRILLGLNRRSALFCVLGAARIASGCELPVGQSLWIRLAAPVTTYTAKPGDAVHAILTQDLVCDNEVIFPMGSAVEGVVRSKRKVGWGIMHETAALELEFNRVIVKPGVDVALTARVEEIQNARELVRKGVIQGVRSTDTFQGTINSRLIHLPTWNPYSDPVLIAYKAIFPIFPEPEIYYPAGVDMHLRTTKEISSPPATVSEEHQSSSPISTESYEIDRIVEQLPWRVTTKKHVDADLLNIVFLGSHEEIESAFRIAGWRSADTVSRRTVMKNLYALLNKSGYAQQPMTTFLLDGKPEDMNWQKSLNSYDRRDHLRIWQWSSGKTTDPVDQETSISPANAANSIANSIWISSSTHDTGAVLTIKYKGFVHHIAPDIDDERSTVIRDLNFAGCIKSVNFISRPGMPTFTHNSTGDIMRTDGSVAVVTLQHCQATEPQFEPDSKEVSFKPGNHTFRYIRRQILTFRSDIWRANIIYAAYDAGRMTFVALHHKPPIQ